MSDDNKVLAFPAGRSAKVIFEKACAAKTREAFVEGLSQLAGTPESKPLAEMIEAIVQESGSDDPDERTPLHVAARLIERLGPEEGLAWAKRMEQESTMGEFAAQVRQAVENLIA